MTVRRETVFDGRAIGRHSVACPRDVAALDPLGEAIVAGSPRYALPTLVASQAQWVTDDTPGGSGNVYSILGAGRDATGEPITFVYGQQSQQCYVYRGTDRSAPYATLDWARSGGTPDVLKGKLNAKANHRHIPSSIAVCDGLIVVACRVTVSGTETYEALLYSQDLGGTWAFVAPRTADAQSGDTDYPTPVTGSSGRQRLNSWAFKNWTPYAWDAAGNVVEAWFHCADYLANTGSPGGQGYIFRATRATSADAWAVTQLRKLETILGSERHLHSGLVTFKHGELEVVEVYGDGNMNEIRRHTFAGARADFLTASITTNRVSGDGTFTGDHRMAYQGAGAAWHPDGDVILSPDNEIGGVHKIGVPATATDPVEVTTLFGNRFGGDAGNLGLHIHADSPHNAGRRAYVASYKQREGGSITALSNAMLYSQDGDHWAIIGAGMSSPYVHGDSIVSMDANGYSLLSRPRPTVALRRPLLCQPRTTNWRQNGNENASLGDGGNVLERCSWTGSTLHYPAAYYSGAAIPGPYPFPVGTNVYYGKSVPADVSRGDSYMGEMLLCSQFNAQGAANRDVSFVAYVRNVGTATRGLAIQFGTGWNTGGEGYGAPKSVVSIPDNAAWFPYVVHRSNVNADFWPHVIVHSQLSNAERAAEFLVTFPFVGPGPANPYMPGTLGGAGSGEFNRVTGLSLTADDWAAAITLSVPDALGVDSWALATDRASWPLVTLYANANNYIAVTMEKGADANAAQSLKATVYRSGASVGTATIANLYTVPGSELLLAISCNGTDTTLAVSINGLPADSATAAAAAPAATPTEWRVGDAGGTDMIPLLVHKTTDAKSMTAGELEAFVASTGMVRVVAVAASVPAVTIPGIGMGSGF